MDTCNHSYNNNPIKQKICITIILNFIYINVHLYTSQLFSHSLNYIFSMWVYHIYSYSFMCISMWSIYPQIQKIEKISHIKHFMACWPLIERVQKLWMSTAFNRETGDCVWWKKHMSICRRRKKSHEISRIYVRFFNEYFLIKIHLKNFFF